MHEIAERAADAARAPSFADLVDRGRRRRSRRHGAVAGAAVALTVATIVGATQLLGGGSSREPQPVPAPSTTISDPSTGVDPSAVVDGRRARVVDVALGATGRGAAVVWEDHDRTALTLSDDGFRTRTDIGLPDGTTVEPALDGSFVVLGGGQRHRVWIARGNGAFDEVTVSEREGVVRPGEVAVVAPDPSFPMVHKDVLAVDAETLTAHWVSGLPPAATSFTAFAGRITALERIGNDYPPGPTTYYWSDDGGRTWGSAELPSTDLSTFEVVPTGSFRPHLVLESGDGATLAPVVALHRMPYGGDAWEDLAYDGPRLTYAVAPDGSWSGWACGDDVCFLGDQWGDGARPPVSSGIYRWGSAGATPADDDRPDVIEQQGRAVVALRSTEEGYTTYVAGPGGALVASFDNRPGEWSDVPAR